MFPLKLFGKTMSKILLEELDADNAEDEPENQADEKHVSNSGNGLDQRVHDHLAIHRTG